ncbi:MAG: biliverdin-producing heme oxygenase [Coxiellaceae bacterium]|nr:biliverdin-producing heme oxygenase [Coxiellaceae bacterium]
MPKHGALEQKQSDEQPLSAQLRAQFFQNGPSGSMHDTLFKHPLMQEDILHRHFKPEILRAYMIGMYFYHAAFEARLRELSNHPHIQPLFELAEIETLFSSAHLKGDLKRQGVNPDTIPDNEVHLLMSRHIKELKSVAQLFAYCYLLPLADLSGGRIMAPILRRKMPEETMDYLSNISAIPSEDLEKRKQSLKEALDVLPPELHQQAHEELTSAIKLTQLWFNSMHQGEPFTLYQEPVRPLTCAETLLAATIVVALGTAVVATMMSYMPEPVVRMSSCSV